MPWLSTTSTLKLWTKILEDIQWFKSQSPKYTFRFIQVGIGIHTTLAYLLFFYIRPIKIYSNISCNNTDIILAAHWNVILFNGKSLAYKDTSNFYDISTGSSDFAQVTDLVRHCLINNSMNNSLTSLVVYSEMMLCSQSKILATRW